MRSLTRSAALIVGLGFGTGAGGQEAAMGAADPAAEAAALIAAYTAQFRPLYIESTAAWWEANLTGSDDAVARKTAADRKLVDLHSDRAAFARLKELRGGDAIRDPVLRRQIDVMYRAYLENQADPALLKRIKALENEVEQTFNTFRSRVGEKTLTENEVRAILANSTDTAAVKAAWKAYMEVGAAADAKLRELVRMRNEVARGLGFRDFYAFNLALQEIDEAELVKLFDELDKLTREPFAHLKTDMDRSRAERFKIDMQDLRPWHFGDLFFQEAPSAGGEVNLDELYRGADLAAVGKTYYAGIGLPVEDILARSDLYEKAGKCPHAFCEHMDRAEDVRILVNLKPNLYWADTILHELGHGVYDKYIGPEVPFVLRKASHAITTEGIAELFGALSKNEEFLREVVQVPPAEAERAGRAAREALRTGRLMFARWAQVMVRFERGMYGNPEQDLAKLWWDLKREYQLLNPPDRLDKPDYAAKVHVLTTPVYYHSYLMGELFAAQVRHKLAHDVLKLDGAAAAATSFAGRPEAGAWLKAHVFAPGNLYPWPELTRRATGEALTPKYFVAEIGREQTSDRAKK
ncbi:MAG: M2 family metallopeptidase [Planctomycetota bacterium]